MNDSARLAEVLLAALAVIREGDVTGALVHGELELPVPRELACRCRSPRAPWSGCCLSLNDFSTCLPLTQ